MQNPTGNKDGVKIQAPCRRQTRYTAAQLGLHLSVNKIKAIMINQPVRVGDQDTNWELRTTAAAAASGGGKDSDK